MKQRVRTEVVTDYMQLCQRVPDILKAYGMSPVYVYTHVLKVSKVTWFKRLKEGVFTPAELLKICKYINNE